MESKARLWQGLYWSLFERNVAGTILTTRNGKILDCNETCAHILGVDSRIEMLRHTAWDFYFDRRDREDLLTRLNSTAECPVEEVCLRRADGGPVWVLTMRTAVQNGTHYRDWLQGTIIDVSIRKQLEERLREIEGDGTDSRLCTETCLRQTDPASKCASLLQELSEALRPENLLTIERGQIQQVLRTLEALKMLVIDLEILHL